MDINSVSCGKHNFKQRSFCKYAIACLSFVDSFTFTSDQSKYSSFDFYNYWDCVAGGDVWYSWFVIGHVCMEDNYVHFPWWYWWAIQTSLREEMESKY